MGRRALRPIHPELDLSGHLRALEELPRPWDTAQLFGRQAPLEVDVGCGKGMFLAGASAEQPETNFLGIERAVRYARYSAARLARQEAKNAIVVAADAQRVFAELLPDASLAAVHVYFPDPWWKARHRKRRVLNATFVRDVERTLIPGGRLHFWTDVEEYYLSTLELLAAETVLRGPLEVVESPAAHDLDYRTNFERRTRQHQRDVYRCEYEKRSTGS